MPAPQLTLGSFNLTDWAGVAYETSVITEGTSRGAPVPLEVAVKSWLQDGSIVVTQGYDNRTVTLRVNFRGPSLTAVAQAEAAFFAELGKPNTLTWTPASGPASVFNVITSSMEASPSADEDIAERLPQPWRTYNVRLVCEAFVRSTTEVVAAALSPSGTTTTLVDNGSSTTGWSGAVDGVSTSPTVSSGAVGITSAAAAGPRTLALTRSGSITTSATPYLMIDWRGMSDGALRAFSSGVELSRVSQANSPTAGYTRTWFYVPGASVTSLLLQQTSSAPFNTARTLYVDNINRTDVRPSFGSARQLLRSIVVTGSARTQGRLAIESPTAGLGYAIVYCWSGGSQGYAPPMRQYRTSGGTVTTDSTQISGAKEVIKSTTITYDVPVSQLNAGTHVLMAKFRTASSISGSTTTVAYASRTYLSSQPISDADSGTATVANSSLSGTSYSVLARLILPTIEVDPNSGAVQRITLNATTTLADLSIDEAWLFNTSIGDLTVAWSDGEGTPTAGLASNRMFLNPASTSTPRPTVKIGLNADRTDARTPRTMMAWQQPQFVPPTVNVFTVTPGALDTDVTLAYYPRWHTHAAS